MDELSKLEVKENERIKKEKDEEEEKNPENNTGREMRRMDLLFVG